MRKQWITFLAIALLLGSIVLTVRADEVEDELENTERDESKTQIQLEGSKLEYESESKSGLESKLHVTAKGGDGDDESFKIEYEFEGTGKNTGVEFEHKFKVRFFSLIEYSESDAAATSTDGYNGTEQVHSNYTVDSWGSWSEQQTPAGADYKMWVIRSGDSKVTVNLYITTASNASVNGIFIDANSAKFDFIVDNFVFQAQGNSFLAVAARVETEIETESDEEEDEDGDVHKLTTKSSGAAIEGVFSWSTTVKATSSSNAVSTVDVIASNFSSDRKSRLGYFAFNAVKPKKIEWDPEVSVKSTGSGTKPNSAASAMVNSVALILLIAIAAFLGL